MLALIACDGGRRAEPVGSLDGYLARVAPSDEPTRQREVATWRLAEPAWRRTVVEPYRALYTEYAAAFDVAAPALVAQLARPGSIATRPHFAGDPRLTPGQARARWALPVAFASQVAAIGDAPIDAVFVRDGEHWRAIVGLDRVIRAHVAALDPGCASLLDAGLRDRGGAGPDPRCRDLGWEIAEAALRTDRARFSHACTLATSLCGKPSP